MMEAPRLHTLYVYLTEGCNLACRHCWMAPDMDFTGNTLPTLPLDAFKTALREARPLGLRAVKLTGGEPLLHPQIGQFLDILRREELAVQIETNGLLCSPRMASEIARIPSRFVAVSLDGVEATTHEWIRGIPGSFAAAKQAITNLVEAGIRPQVVCTVLRANIDQIKRMVPFAESLGAASLKFNVVQPTARGRGVHEQQEAPGIAELISLGRHVETTLAQASSMSVLFDHPPAFRSLRRLNARRSASCGLFGILGVLAQGTYALCGIGGQVGALVFGTIGKDSLEGIWRTHPVLCALREGLPRRLEGICGRCLMKGGCLGNCIAQNYYRCGSFWAPYWFCQAADELGLFPPSRRI